MRRRIAIGANAETASLQRVAPAYFTTIRDWLAKRIRGFRIPGAGWRYGG